MFKSDTQPYCRACGQPIGKVTDSHYFAVQTFEEAIGRQSAVPGKYYRARPTTRAEVERLIGERPVSVHWNNGGPNHGPSDFIRKATTWDGASYVDMHFCNDRCAASFGRMAARTYPALKMQRSYLAARARHMSETRS